MTITSTAASMPSRMADRTLPCSACTSTTRPYSSRPITRKMALSNSISRVRQTASVVSRSCGRRYFGDPWPVTSPATTAATRPDASSRSAGM